MPAAKTATTEAPSLHDLAGEIQRATIRARAELDDVRRRLADLRGEREAILNAPLAACDLASEIVRHIQKKSHEAHDFLRLTLQEMRDRSGSLATTAPETMATYDPFDKRWLPQVCALLADPEAAALRVLQAVGELDGTIPEGLPLERRREAVTALDQKIAAAVETESALVESLAAAGIQIPVENAPEPEPQPGERRVIGGKLQEWVTFTGRDYGWWPVEQAA